jgi:hypothetical protein
MHLYEILARKFSRLRPQVLQALDPAAEASGYWRGRGPKKSVLGQALTLSN